jgi:hypothetical protein
VALEVSEEKRCGAGLTRSEYRADLCKWYCRKSGKSHKIKTSMHRLEITIPVVSSRILNGV